MSAKDELQEKDGSYFFCGMYFVIVAASVILAVLMQNSERWGRSWIINLMPMICIVGAAALIIVAIAKAVGLGSKTGASPISHLIFSLNLTVFGIVFYQLFYRPLDIHVIITLMIPVLMLGLDFILYGALNR